MKVVFGLLALFALVGVVYVLAFFGIIPVQKLADKSPALASKLVLLHLAKPKKPLPVAAAGKAAPDPQQLALDAGKKQLAPTAPDWTKTGPTLRPKISLPPRRERLSAVDPAGDTAAKLIAIYAAMSPDDIARIFAKTSDPDVVAALTQLDEKKAAKILAALPDDRAARLTRRMSHPSMASVAPLRRTSL